MIHFLQCVHDNKIPKVFWRRDVTNVEFLGTNLKYLSTVRLSRISHVCLQPEADGAEQRPARTAVTQFIKTPTLTKRCITTTPTPRGRPCSQSASFPFFINSKCQSRWAFFYVCLCVFSVARAAVVFSLLAASFSQISQFFKQKPTMASKQTALIMAATHHTNTHGSWNA